MDRQGQQGARWEGCVQGKKRGGARDGRFGQSSETAWVVQGCVVGFECGHVTVLSTYLLALASHTRRAEGAGALGNGMG